MCACFLVFVFACTHMYKIEREKARASRSLWVARRRFDLNANFENRFHCVPMFFIQTKQKTLYIFFAWRQTKKREHKPNLVWDYVFFLLDSRVLKCMLCSYIFYRIQEVKRLVCVWRLIDFVHLKCIFRYFYAATSLFLTKICFEVFRGHRNITHTQ